MLGNFACFNMCKQLHTCIFIITVFFSSKIIFQEHLKSAKQFEYRSGPRVIKLFSWSAQLGMEFILLINVKMPTIVGILTFINRINTTSDSFKAKRMFDFYFRILVAMSN